MTEKNDAVIGHLNDLIETCTDGEEGYRAAAEAIAGETDPDMRTLFNVYAQQRARFAAELQNEVLRRGGEPVKAGHVSAAFHRGWLNLKAALTGKDEFSIIGEIESGEQAAMRNYEHILKQNLPSDILAIVEAQYAEVRQAHHRILSLQRAYRAA
jgi:uncharacterized protein (TIGR02284 family)